MCMSLGKGGSLKKWDHTISFLSLHSLYQHHRSLSRSKAIDYTHSFNNLTPYHEYSTTYSSVLPQMYTKAVSRFILTNNTTIHNLDHASDVSVLVSKAQVDFGDSLMRVFPNWISPVNHLPMPFVIL